MFSKICYLKTYKNMKKKCFYAIFLRFLLEKHINPVTNYGLLTCMVLMGYLVSETWV